MNTILITIISLCAIGIVSAVILYIVAQKFKVEEDPRIDTVEGLLPGANCGGCGYPGCRGLAEAIVKADDLEGLFCPVGGSACMKKIAEALGREVCESAPQTAVIRCNGSCANRPRINRYDGAPSCTIQHALYAGETACTYGCLGCGDCVEACTFDAIDMDATTGLPVVNERCIACGACVKACPRSIIELRNKGPKERRIFVACINKEKGGIAKKACQVACIGCTKCAKECSFEAITIENNLAYIDFTKCRLCRKCVGVCPTGAIHEINFPARKITQEKEISEPVKPEPVVVTETVPVDPAETTVPEDKEESLVETVASETEPEISEEQLPEAATQQVPEVAPVVPETVPENVGEKSEAQQTVLPRKIDLATDEEIDFKI